MDDLPPQKLFDNNFDIATLTCPKIRNIFVQYGIKYKPSSNKSDLVNTFNSELKPQGPDIIAEAKAVKRSSKGIINASPVSATRSYLNRR